MGMDSTWGSGPPALRHGPTLLVCGRGAKEKAKHLSVGSLPGEEAFQPQSDLEGEGRQPRKSPLPQGLLKSTQAGEKEEFCVLLMLRGDSTFCAQQGSSWS